MAFTFKPLWKMLIDKNMTKKALREQTNISKSTMDKMTREEYVSMEILDRICTFFNCEVQDIIKHSKSEK